MRRANNHSFPSFQHGCTTSKWRVSILKCDRTAVIDVALHIRLGTALILGDVQWLITDQQVGEPLLGSPLLEALGLNTREILSAAANKHGGQVDVSSRA